jgi:hypothetical protein
MKPGFAENPSHQASRQGSTICFVAFRPILSRKAALPPLEDSRQDFPSHSTELFRKARAVIVKFIDS